MVEKITVEALQRMQDDLRAAQPPQREPEPIPERQLPTPEQIEAADRRARESIRLAALDEKRERLAAAFHNRERYRGCTLENFLCEDQHERLQAVEQMRQFIDRLPSSTGLLLLGPPGTGKDHLMAAAIAAAVERKMRVAWRNGMDLFGEVRDRMSEEQDERTFVANLVRPDVLAISDPLPPFGDLTQFQAATLFRVIDGRYSRNKPTWATMNVASKKEAEQRLGSQIVDRLTHGAVVVKCNWESYRKAFDAFNRGEG